MKGSTETHLKPQESNYRRFLFLALIAVFNQASFL